MKKPTSIKPLVKKKDPPKKIRLQKFPVEIVHGPNLMLNFMKEWYLNQSVTSFVLDVPVLPPSTNDIYRKSSVFNGHQGRMNVHVRLNPEVDQYRDYIWRYFTKNSIRPQPTNILVAVVELYGEWLNKDRTTKQRDADNMIKSLFDAIEEATHIPDEIIHVFHTFKMHGQDRCLVTVYEVPAKIYTS